MEAAVTVNIAFADSEDDDVPVELGRSPDGESKGD